MLRSVRVVSERSVADRAAQDHVKAAAPINPTSIKAEAHMTRSRVRETDTGTTASTCGALNTSSISNLASAMWASLRLRSFSRQRRSSLRTGSGVVWGNAFQSGSLSSIAASVSEIVSPANGGRPVSIS